MSGVRKHANPVQLKGKQKEKMRKAIWDTFLQNELADYEKFMGYGKKEIKRLGIKSFIEMNGWYTPEDVSKWRTDRLHISICLHCNNAWTVFMLHDNMGFCDRCRPKYDIDRFFNAYQHFRAEDPHKSSALWHGFFAYADIRRLFLKEPNTTEQSVSADIEERVAAIMKMMDETVSPQINAAPRSMSLDDDEIEPNIESVVASIEEKLTEKATLERYIKGGESDDAVSVSERTGEADRGRIENGGGD